MTTTPADKPDDASAVDPGAIDLDVYRHHEAVMQSAADGDTKSYAHLAAGFIHNLIAEIVALRERVAELEDKIIDMLDGEVKLARRAVDAEARVVDSYAAGLEAAAKWHDSRVQKIHPSCDGPTRTCHVESAKAIRALGKEEGHGLDR